MSLGEINYLPRMLLKPLIFLQNPFLIADILMPNPFAISKAVVPSVGGIFLLAAIGQRQLL